LLLLGRNQTASSPHYRDTLTTPAFVVWLFGLIVATLFPPAVAVIFWFGSKRRAYGWLLHFLLLPVSYAVVRGAISIMLMIAGEPDGDGLTGWATDPAVMLMLLCPLIYFAALGMARLRKRSVSADN
jgi:hypothetical protein